MSNEIYTADLEVRVRSNEAGFMLRRYRAERDAGREATVAMFDREIMRVYGPNLALMEMASDGEFTFLYAGAQVPDGGVSALKAKSTADIDSATAELYRMGCAEAEKADDAICINHQSGMNAAVHRWECLFLPMRDGAEQRIFAALCIPREPKFEFFRAILDAMPNGALVATPIRDGNNEIVDAALIAANVRAVEMTGRGSLDALLASSLSAAFGEGVDVSGWDRNFSVLRNGKPLVFDFHCYGEQGSRWFQVHSTPIRDGILISMTDVSDMKRAFLEIEHQKKMLIDEMEQRRGLEQELWALAHLDPLTGLPNRRAFRDAAMLKLAEAQTAHRPCAIITMDIDHFKRVNDVFGHGAGDIVLRRVADIIKAPLRPNTDIGARMGGEEFTVLLPDTDADAAAAFAEKLRRRVEQTVVIVGENEIRPTISLGVALTRKSTDLDDLIDRADRALYAAKRNGRNKVTTELEVQDTNKARPPGPSKGRAESGKVATGKAEAASPPAQPDPKSSAA